MSINWSSSPGIVDLKKGLGIIKVDTKYILPFLSETKYRKFYRGGLWNWPLERKKDLC